MTQINDPRPDPFGSYDKVPSLSFRDAPVGASVRCRVLEFPTEAQSRDFDTGKPATWDNGDPKMAIVTRVDVNGTQYAIWAVRPSAMFNAIAEAQQRAGRLIDANGWLTITYTGDKADPQQPHKNPAKQYHAEYEPPNVFDSAPATNGQQQQAAAAPQTAPQPQPVAAAQQQQDRPWQPPQQLRDTTSPGQAPAWLQQQPQQQTAVPDEPPF